MSVTGASGEPWKNAPSAVRPNPTAAGSVAGGAGVCVGGGSVISGAAGSVTSTGAAVAGGAVALATTGGGTSTVLSNAVGTAANGSSIPADVAQPADIRPKSSNRIAVFIRVILEPGCPPVAYNFITGRFATTDDKDGTELMAKARVQTRRVFARVSNVSIHSYFKPRSDAGIARLNLCSSVKSVVSSAASSPRARQSSRT